MLALLVETPETNTADIRFDAAIFWPQNHLLAERNKMKITIQLGVCSQQHWKNFGKSKLSTLKKKFNLFYPNYQQAFILIINLSTSYQNKCTKFRWQGR